MAIYKMYCRSSCYPNPGSGGFVVLIEDSTGKMHDPLLGGFFSSTNNQVEHSAFETCIKWFNNHKQAGDSAVVYSKSKIKVDSFNKISHDGIKFEFVEGNLCAHAKGLSDAISATLTDLLGDKK